MCLNILPQLLLHIHSYSLTLPCRSIVGELHFFMAFTIYVLLLKLSKRLFAALRKAFFKYRYLRMAHCVYQGRDRHDRKQ